MKVDDSAFFCRSLFFIVDRYIWRDRVFSRILFVSVCGNYSESRRIIVSTLDFLFARYYNKEQVCRSVIGFF